MDSDDSMSLEDVSMNSDIENFADLDVSGDNSVIPITNERMKMVHDLMILFITQKFTFVCLEETAKFSNKMPGATLQLPTTKFLLLNEFFAMSSIKAFQYTSCSNSKCKELIKSEFRRAKSLTCSSCKSSVTKEKFFIYISLKSQLQAIVQNNFETILKFKQKVMENSESITDCYNSDLLKNKLLLDENIFSLTFNTDGVALQNSNDSSLWPIMFTCNFLPPELRFNKKNIIVVGLYFDKGKPEMLEFCKPLAEEMQFLQEDGIMVNMKNFRFYITVGAMDLPAKCSLQQMTQYNGYSSCNYCEHPGISTEKGVRYNVSSLTAPRQHDKIVESMAKLHRLPNTATINGIKGLSPMIAFDHFDLCISFAIDYMHAVLLGVFKTLLMMFLNPAFKDKPFYINKKKQQTLNNRITQIKLCQFIKRKP